MARSLLSQQKMPSEYWGEAVRHAVHILNKLPTRSISAITPHEAWFHRKPSVEHLKVFRYTAYMKIPSAHTTKLDARSKLVVHLGREPGTKAYRLYDPVSRSIHISRDVIFNEQNGWDWESDKYTAIHGTEHFVLNDHTVETTEDYTTYATSEPSTPDASVHGSITGANADTRYTYDDSETPRRFRHLQDIYGDTTEIELEEELLLMWIDEPVCFEQAVKDDVWKDAMDK